MSRKLDQSVFNDCLTREPCERVVSVVNAGIGPTEVIILKQSPVQHGADVGAARQGPEREIEDIEMMPVVSYTSLKWAFCGVFVAISMFYYAEVAGTLA